MIRHVAYSPDGKQIVFSVYLQNVGEQLEVMPAAGGTPVRIGPAGLGQRVSWQPTFAKNPAKYAAK